MANGGGLSLYAIPHDGRKNGVEQYLNTSIELLFPYTVLPGRSDWLAAIPTYCYKFQTFFHHYSRITIIHKCQHPAIKVLRRYTG